MRVLVPAFVLCCIAAMGVMALSDPDPIAQTVLKAMNQSADPCVDFFEYACGGWIAATPLPPTKGQLNRGFGNIEDYNNKVLATVFANSSTNPKLLDFYASCMDTATINGLGLAPLQPVLDSFTGIQSAGDFMFAVGHLQLMGFPALFSLSVGLDDKNPGTNIAVFGQGGYALPDRTFYLDNSTDGQQLLEQYKAHMAAMFVLLGDTPDQASAEAEAAYGIELGLARVALPNEDLLNPFATYNKLDLDGLQTLTGHTPWSPFMVGVEHYFTQINVQTPAFFEGMDLLINSTTPSEWISYLRWTSVYSAANLLSAPFVNESFNFFGKIINGKKEMQPRNETCISQTDAGLGDLVGAAYVAIAFSGNSRDAAQTMINEIEAAFHNDLGVLPWMDNITRAQAILKLSKVANMIGYPSKPDSYPSLSPNPATFYENAISAVSYGVGKQLRSIGGPKDPDAWEMTADTVNAYYDPTRNQMVFPAAILQAPYFDIAHPDAMNYGGSGMIMGHELTHGFDPQGRFYNGSGYLINWWQNATAEAFQKKANCLIAQYSKFEVLPGLFINGNQTQGENTADCGGIKSAYNAYTTKAGDKATQPSIVPGLSNIELFFVAYAQGWCAVSSPAYLRMQVASDVHSPARFRVLGPLMNLPQFSSTFKCAANTPMNPSDRCEIW